jgi:hypothetical protein
MNLNEIEQLVINSEEVDMSDDDFGIIIGPDGKLKLLLLPDEIQDSSDVPDIITEIISMFDESTIYNQNRVVH